MDKKLSDDPRSVRARQGLQEALKELLKTKPFSKITVTDIAGQAGFARHTFYNHYDTKEDLLHTLVDSILDEMFSGVGPWDLISRDPEGDRKVGTRFFEIWLDHADSVKVLQSVDIDSLLINRLKLHFTNYYYEYGSQEITGMGEEMARYLIHYNAYSFAGILLQWFNDDMVYPPEVMGQFWGHFGGIKTVNAAIDKFKDVIR
jgi:AcrR family transcriptional regulator